MEAGCEHITVYKSDRRKLDPILRWNRYEAVHTAMVDNEPCVFFKLHHNTGSLYVVEILAAVYSLTFFKVLFLFFLPGEDFNEPLHVTIAKKRLRAQLLYHLQSNQPDSKRVSLETILQHNYGPSLVLALQSLQQLTEANDSLKFLSVQFRRVLASVVGCTSVALTYFQTREMDACQRSLGDRYIPPRALDDYFATIGGEKLVSDFRDIIDRTAAVTAKVALRDFARGRPISHNTGGFDDITRREKATIRMTRLNRERKAAELAEIEAQTLLEAESQTPTCTSSNPDDNIINPSEITTVHPVNPPPIVPRNK